MHPLLVVYARMLCFCVVLAVVVQFDPSDAVMLALMIPMGVLLLWWLVKALWKPGPEDRRVLGRLSL
jgi:hypothetical protein